MTLNNLFEQLPAIFVVAPLLASLMILLSANSNIARIIFALTNIALFSAALFCVTLNVGSHVYAFGNWPRPIGIEFKIDHLFLSALTLQYFICMMFSIFAFTAFKERFDRIIQPGRRHIPYALFLLVEAGYSGIILTNDIFNLYVFLELASLASYPLIAISMERKSLIAAFEYLVIGTIAATIILVSIGFILSISGSLNLDDIKIFFKTPTPFAKYISMFFVVGALVKIAIFPLHSWKIKSYSYTSPVITCFFISISSLCAIIMLIKFRFLVDLIAPNSKQIINYVGVASLLFGSVIALQEESYRKIIIYSSISTIGYYLLLWPYSNIETIYLLIQIVAIDSIIKFGLCIFPLAIGKEEFSTMHLIGLLNKNRYISIIFVFILLNAASLPITVGFFNKLSVINYFMTKHIIYVITISLCSLFSAIYYIGIFRQIIKTSDVQYSFKINLMAFTGMIFVVITLFAMLFSQNVISSLAHSIYIEGVR